MTLTDRDWVSDLWVLARFRGLGAGTALLAAAETEIAGRGHVVARLRLWSRTRRRGSSTTSRGWLAVRKFPHEHLPVTMIEMEKHLRAAT